MLIQFLADFVCGFSQKKLLKNEPHHPGLFFYDDPVLIGYTIRVAIDRPWISKSDSFLKPLLNTPTDILGNRIAFFLCQCRKDGQEQFAGSIQRINVFLLKVYTDWRVALPKLSHTVQRIDRISGKSGNGLCDDVVDFPIQRIPHHLVEFGAVIAVGAGGRFICIHTGKCPALFFIDQLRVIAFLPFIRSLLGKLIGRNTAVGCHSDVFCLFQLTSG